MQLHPGSSYSRASPVFADSSSSRRPVPSQQINRKVFGAQVRIMNTHFARVNATL